MNCPVGQNLESLPPRMADLLTDDRGYIIPWFVDYIDGKPEFRAMDQRKWIAAIREKLCWVCGGKLGIHVTFVAGPMCGVNRTSSEPPSHRDCALWSAMNCPFLSNPRMVRREDEQFNNQTAAEKVAGFAITRNPGVTMLWNTRQFDVFKTETGPLITMGEPESVEWLRCGKPATRAEIMDSIETGLPALEALARQEKGGIEFLTKSVARLQKWIPTDTNVVP